MRDNFMLFRVMYVGPHYIHILYKIGQECNSVLYHKLEIMATMKRFSADRLRYTSNSTNAKKLTSLLLWETNCRRKCV